MAPSATSVRVALDPPRSGRLVIAGEPVYGGYVLATTLYSGEGSLRARTTLFCGSCATHVFQLRQASLPGPSVRANLRWNLLQVFVRQPPPLPDFFRSTINPKPVGQNTAQQVAFRNRLAGNGDPETSAVFLPQPLRLPGRQQNRDALRRCNPLLYRAGRGCQIAIARQKESSIIR
jgi:hypothetical protein